MRRNDRPLTHDWIWGAIDALAARHGLSPSGLARLAGLDPTAFNRSKRMTPEGRPRWPSTESIAKVLQATATSLDEFAATELGVALGGSADLAGADLTAVPVVGEVRDAAVTGWEPDLVLVPGPKREPRGQRRFALAVGDSSLEPAYSIGHTLVVSEAADSRAGDRVVVKPRGMPVLPRLLVSTSPTAIELGSLGGGRERLAVERRCIDWMARIVLVRQ